VRRLALALAATLAVLILALTGAAAQAAPTQRTSLHAVESEVMCVSCGVPLAIAESPQADAERREITRLIAQGKTKQEILDSLVANYGKRVLASPESEGFGLAAYLVPIALVVLALIAGAILLPKWKNRERATAPDDDAARRLTDADSDRLDQDLAKYRI
jgi:cytochrome c-type biogenesis protein CcmH/NrfF